MIRGTTLIAGVRPLFPMPTHRLPHNAGNASADTQVSPFALPSAAHLLLRFSPHSQHRGLSVDAQATLSPLQRFGY